MRSAILITMLVVGSSAAPAEEVAYRVTGLFSPVRVDDLKEAMRKVEGATLKSVDFATASAVFDIADRRKMTIEKLDQELRKQTFGAKGPLLTPPDKLKEIEIDVVGLDCKGCAYGAYLGVYQIDGVERATVSFKDGKVRALIDTSKTNREALVEGLRKKRVTIAGEAEKK
ncbi:MAG TPA: hypothetical protein VK986_07210 [Tepidisphaeraceae bacterium]|nr:hypothetical protein [Tepidisphaeraceae bacterium]